MSVKYFGYQIFSDTDISFSIWYRIRFLVGVTGVTLCARLYMVHSSFQGLLADTTLSFRSSLHPQ